MKFKLLFADSNGTEIPIIITCDSATLVNEVASHLCQNVNLNVHTTLSMPGKHLGYVTLTGRAPGQSEEVMFDPLQPMDSCGLKSGWRIKVVWEFATSARRITPTRARVEVLNTEQAGAKFSLLQGENTVGRAVNSRVPLHHKSVSRRHAVITVGKEIVVHDLGSVNGVTAQGQQIERLPIAETTDVQFGDVLIRVTPMKEEMSSAQPPVHQQFFTRSPLIQPVFVPTSRQLPEPPQLQQVNRLPLLAMATPMIAGMVMFAVTQSPMSLVMVALSPLMMIGSWIDAVSSSRRKGKIDFKRFQSELTEERNHLVELRTREIQSRSNEVPTKNELHEAIIHKSTLLWSRNPQRAEFLSLSLGMGTMPSRNILVLPQRKGASTQQWQELCVLQSDFESVSPVPLTADLRHSGSIGIAPLGGYTADYLKSLIVQMAGLHSPTEVNIVAVLGRGAPLSDWTWMAWLPHVNFPNSPLPSEHLAINENETFRLITDLEDLIRARTQVTHFQRDNGTFGSQRDKKANNISLPVIIVICFDSGHSDAHRSRLIAIAEEGPARNVHVIWVAGDPSQVPAACATFHKIETEVLGGEVFDTSTNAISELEKIDLTNGDEAATMAQLLASVVDASEKIIDQSDLPKSVNLSEIHPVDFLDGASSIVKGWDLNNTLKSNWIIADDEKPLTFKAIVGLSSCGVLEIDIRDQGPHALIAGTTGSGKSEFLQTLIMSHAIHASPDCLNFLLFDYKGGAAFAECVDLPHTVGLVTDLTPHLARRALDSLAAELRYRERLLAEFQAKDLLTLERHREKSAPPVLMIVIDEYAALASEMPEFIDGILDIAQRGRSLGLHLILATQRPAGIVKDSIRANTNLRIALRMTDTTDSVDVIGSNDAATFDVSVPGRAVMTAGGTQITHFQTAFLGNSSFTTANKAKIEIEPLGLVERQHWDWGWNPDVSAMTETSKEKGKRDIEVIRDFIITANSDAGLRAPRKPWLNQLDKTLSFSELKQKSNNENFATAEHEHGISSVILGLADVPSQQQQVSVGVNFDEIGNLALFGASGTGKTTALISLTAILTEDTHTNPVHVFVIDAASGGLKCLDILPTVATVTTLSDRESVMRILRSLIEIIQQRSKQFSEAHAHDLTSYRLLTTECIPRIFLLIDGYEAFQNYIGISTLHNLAKENFTEILQLGRALGVHVVLTALRPAEMPSSLSSSVQQSFFFRPGSQADYLHLGMQIDCLAEGTPGRCVFKNEQLEVQLAHIGESPDLLFQVAALEKIANQLSSEKLTFPPKMNRTPTRISLNELLGASPTQPVVGVEIERLEPVFIDSKGLGLIAGPSQSGLSTAARTCVESVQRLCAQRGKTVQTILLSFVNESSSSSPLAISWGRIARGHTQVKELASLLINEMGGRVPEVLNDGAPLGVRRHSDISSWGGDYLSNNHQVVVVVERSNDAEGTDALPYLVALAKCAKRSHALVIFEFETNSPNNVWELLSVLKQPTWAIALQPDENDSATPIRENFGRVKRSDFQPGRGFFMASGRVSPVLIAETEPQNASRREAARSG